MKIHGRQVLSGFHGSVDEVRRDEDHAGLGDDVLLHLRAQVELDLGSEVLRVVGIGPDVEQQLGVLVDVRRMADLEERLVVRQHPVDHVEVAARQHVLVDPGDHLERDAFGEVEPVAPVVVVDVLGVLLLAFADLDLGAAPSSEMASAGHQ